MIPTTIAPKKGHIWLHFYVPRDYRLQKRLGKRLHPLVVNFHGGGFTLGEATDDARWCRILVQELNAVVVSVDYRLAPEHPFPTAIEDGVDAILYLSEHAREFNIDLEKIVVSGFSSGGNMAFTVPLRLQEELVNECEAGEERRESVIEARRPPFSKALSEGRFLTRVNRQINIKAVVAWYPPTDFTRTREERRATQAERLDQQLPAIFTELFDESYLSPPTMDRADPYLSPGVAPDHMLACLPKEVILYTCEWDMLLKEAEDFQDKLLDLGKTVHYEMIPGVPHAWDKAPNPLRETPGVNQWYSAACKELKLLLGITRERRSSIASTLKSVETWTSRSRRRRC
jgi:acetyl esterase/lipase